MGKLGEDIAGIKQQLVDMDKRQEAWWNLLTDRIPKWDASSVEINQLTGRRAIWDSTSTKVNLLLGGSGVIGLGIAAFNYFK